MLDILARLTAIKHYAKDIHYNAKGDSFYAVHLLMDNGGCFYTLVIVNNAMMNMGLQVYFQ